MPMKRGSGNLDFGSGEASGDEDAESETENQDKSTQDTGSEPDRPVTQSPPAESEPEPASTDDSDEDSSVAEAEDNENGGDQEQFPYFVRRNNVGDERDDRIEVHLRKSVHSQESAFRNQLADELGTEEVSKTDAREFALKFAFENPEGVAELMREEGFGLID